MKYKYLEYKESDIKWAGLIPLTWQVSKIKFVTNNEDGKREPISGEFRYEKSGEYPYYGATGIVDYINDYKYEGKYLLIGEDGAPFFTPNKNVAFIAEGKFWVNNHAHVLSNKPDINLDFLCYLLNCVDYREYISGSTRDKLTKTDLSDIKIILPEIKEQTKIAQYLDHQTSIIDELIQQKEKLIELLKEKRQAVINEAVTKGLNPNAKMIDSGIEWLGEIPNHWAFMPLKYLTNKDRGIQTGPFGTQLNTKDYTENGIKVLNQKTLIDEDYHSGEEYISSEKMKELNGFEVIGGDILLGTRGSFGTKSRTTFGKCSIVPNNIKESVLHPCLIRIRLSEDLITKNYFKYYVNDSTYFLEHLLNTSNSTTIEVIYGVTLKSIKFPVPPISEQNEIVLYLDKKVGELDKIISLERTQIEKLKEYRQSIISEAVTGKIDVRDWQPNKQKVA